MHDEVVTVHEHTQGASQHRRFTPVYRNTTNNRLEPKLKPKRYYMYKPVLHEDAPMGHAMVVGDISTSGYIPQSLLDNLRSLGVLDA